MVMVSCKVCWSVSLTGWHWVGPRMVPPPFLAYTKEACCNAWAYISGVILPICDLLSLSDVHHRFQAATVRRRLEGLAHVVEREAVANQRRDPHDAMLDELQRRCEVVRGEVMAAGEADLAIVDQIRV